VAHVTSQTVWLAARQLVVALKLVVELQLVVLIQQLLQRCGSVSARFQDIVRVGWQGSASLQLAALNFI
jgi:hypothetical protein